MTDLRHRKLADALIRGDLQRERENLEALCKRLRIAADEPEAMKWVLIGMTLAKEQGEFTGKLRRKGRPRKGPLDSIDVKRALKVEEIQQWVEREMGRRP
jgi:hypothetical protein